MNKYWGYYCKDCEEESETWFNHGGEKLSQYFGARQIIKDNAFLHVEIEPLGSKWDVCEMEGFLNRHEGHNLCLVSECGEYEEFKQPPRTLFELELDDGRCFRLEEKDGKYTTIIVQEFETMRDALLPFFAGLDEESIDGFMARVKEAVG